MSDTTTKLETFADQYDGDLDTLSLDERDECQHKLRKATAMESRDATDRADTLREEVADAIGADLEDDGTDVDTLSAAQAKRVLEDYDLETLNTVWKIEKEIETLKRKRGTFESRDMPGRVEELETEMAVLAAAKGEIQAAGGSYEDVDTLAKRATRDGLVLETHHTPDGIQFSTRETGGAGE